MQDVNVASALMKYAHLKTKNPFAAVVIMNIGSSQQGVKDGDVVQLTEIHLC